MRKQKQRRWSTRPQGAPTREQLLDEFAARKAIAAGRLAPSVGGGSCLRRL